MDLVALTALTTPGTPAHALATIAAGPTTVPARVYLRAHPNTPPHAQPAVLLTSPDSLRIALDSPALTSGTQTRILTAARVTALQDAASHTGVHALDPRPVRELASRSETTNLAIARLLIDHPHVDPDAQVEALHVVANHVESSTAPRIRSRIVLAAAHHPDHLRTLAAAAARSPHMTGTLLAADLLNAADAHDAGHDPIQTVVNATRKLRGSDPVDEAITHCPDPRFALETYQRHQDDPPWLTVLEAVALIGSPVWRLAHLAARSIPFDPRTHLPADPAHAAALHATRITSHVTRSSAQPLDGDVAVLDAAAAVARRLAPSTDLVDLPELAAHLTRLLLHPATPTNHLPALTRIARDVATRLLPVHGETRDELNLTLDLTAAGHDHITTALGHIPMPTLSVAARQESSTRTHLLTHWAAPLLADVWPDPALTRTVLALAPTYPGTLLELLATARTITT